MTTGIALATTIHDATGRLAEPIERAAPVPAGTIDWVEISHHIQH